MIQVRSAFEIQCVSFLLLAGIVLATPVSAQVEPPAMEWVQDIDGLPPRTIPYSLELTADDGCIIAARRLEGLDARPLIPQGALLIKLDADGSVMWWNDYPSDERFYAVGHDAQQTSDGGYITTGSFNFDGYLVKTDAKGDTVWEEALRWQGLSVRQTADHGFILAGGNPSRRARAGILRKIGSQGTHQWETVFNKEDPKEDFFVVRETADGEYIVAGSVLPQHNGVHRGFLAKASGDGTVQWKRHFERALTLSGLAVTADGESLVTGVTHDPARDLYVARTDSKGDLLWERTMEESCGGNTDGQSVQELRDGSFLLAPGLGNCLLRIDGRGEVLWRRICDFYVRAARQAVDGGYLVVGQVVSDDRSTRRVRLMKLAPEAPVFRRGDANADGELNLADPVTVLSALFAGGGDVACADAADSDDNGSINLTDAALVLNHLFAGGPEPSAPFGNCGVDPTEDPLGCAMFAACAGG